MTKRTKVFLGLFTILLLLLLSFGRQRPPVVFNATSEQASKTDRVNRSPRVSSPDTDLELKYARLDVPITDVTQAAMLWSNTFPEQAVRFAALIAGENAPIHFFGQCIDQDGKALPGVLIKMGVRQWKGISRIDLRGDELKFDRISDANGRYELRGVNGDVASVNDAIKQGYRWIRSGTVSRNFARPRTDLPPLNEPVILQFWKLQPAEAMYAAKPPQRQHVACDKQPSSYSLKSGFKTEEGAGPLVRFTMDRDPVMMNSLTKGRPSWELKVEIPGGGVQQTFTNMPFIAPAEGYVGAVTLGRRADDPEWVSRTNATLYFRTAEGNFGRMEIDLTALTDGSVASLNWQSYLNPSGSPVLEYDPAKTIKVPPLFPQTVPYQQRSSPPPPPAPPGPPQSGIPAFLQPPPGFQALTNRSQGFGPPVPPRPQ